MSKLDEQLEQLELEKEKVKLLKKKVSLYEKFANFINDPDCQGDNFNDVRNNILVFVKSSIDSIEAGKESTKIETPKGLSEEDIKSLLNVAELLKATKGLKIPIANNNSTAPITEQNLCTTEKLEVPIVKPERKVSIQEQRNFLHSHKHLANKTVKVQTGESEEVSGVVVGLLCPNIVVKTSQGVMTVPPEKILV